MLKPGDVVTLQADFDSKDRDKQMTVEMVDGNVACCVRLVEMDTHPQRELYRMDALHKVEFDEAEEA